ncbi:MAG: D-glycero-alpha-D-manno-heptose-1,7-bisphosphate 7-phosphatase [Bacteroidia bacterium]
MNKALILDRDGIINIDRGTYTWRQEDWKWNPGIFELVKTAKERGYQIAVATNQAGIARGRYNHEDVEAIHAFMREGFASHGIEIPHIFYCPHYPAVNGKCLCRKPGHLNIQKALAVLNADPALSFMIGDNETDMIAGKKAGCATVLIGGKESEYADVCLGGLGEFQTIKFS